MLSSQALALRCGSKIIKEGHSSSRLLEFCGEPARVESKGWRQRSYDPGYGGGRAGHYYNEVQVVEWTYNFGPNKLMRVVRLENGWVVDIRKLGYGFRD